MFEAVFEGKGTGLRKHPCDATCWCACWCPPASVSSDMEAEGAAWWYDQSSFQYHGG